jgi:hypothetical protein
MILFAMMTLSLTAVNLLALESSTARQYSASWNHSKEMTITNWKKPA